MGVSAAWLSPTRRTEPRPGHTRGGGTRPPWTSTNGGVTTARDALVQHGADGGERAWPVDRRTPPRRASTVCGEPTTDHHVGPTALDDPRRPLAALDDEPAPGRQPAGRVVADGPL